MHALWHDLRFGARSLGNSRGFTVAAIATGARLLASLLYGVPTHDLIAFVGAPLLLIAISLAASYIPVRRALGVDHVVTLRHE